MNTVFKFRDLPIGNKLAIAFILVTVIALASATSFYAYTTWQHEKEAARSELLAVANLIGANSTAALAFNDKTAAQETLATVVSVPGVVHAVLYNKDGEALARFDRTSQNSVNAPISSESQSDSIDIKVASDVVLDNTTVGNVVLYASLAPRLQELRDNVLSVIIASIASLAIALLIAWRLQQSITRPVSRLTSVMQRVSTSNDYTVRADIQQHDEIGMLADGINQMLKHVQQRDAQLEQHRHELESEVSRRTAALKDANEKLRSELEERNRIEAGLKEAHDALERHHRDFSLLSEMNDRLQVCHAVDEMRPVVAHYARKLFPNSGGALYVYNHSRSLVEPLVVWGDEPPSEDVFRQYDCWALRQGRVHTVDNPDTGLICPHCSDAIIGPYLCIPMIAYGDVMGVLHLTLAESEKLTSSLEQLVISASEHLALALANLQLREALQAQSVRDPLTGLFNRRYMQETLERELARTERMGTGLCVIMLDVDHFKNFNDTYGHEAGDLVLHEIGSYLQKAIRTEDIACRYGGEEILVIMPGIDTDNAYIRAEELRKGIKNISLQHKGQTLTGLSISLGVAIAPVNGNSADSLVDAADAALYKAKRAGRDQVMMASEQDLMNS